jgi:XTP/dITP diphosphohydrolase
MKLTFVTSNKNKLNEVKEILPNHTILNKNIELTEIQGDTTSIVKHKIKQAYEKIKKPCFVEDTSLVFNAFGKLPGPYIKHFIKNIGINKLNKLLDSFKNKSGYACCTIGYHDGEKIHIFNGIIKGKIVKPTGKTSFAWDPIFMPKGYNKTFAEMTKQEKNKISHRSIAFKKFEKYLQNEKRI